MFSHYTGIAIDEGITSRTDASSEQLRDVATLDASGGTALNGYEPLLPIPSQLPINFTCFSGGPDVVQQHCGRFLTQDKPALAAGILNDAENQYEELCQTKVRPSAT